MRQLLHNPKVFTDRFTFNQKILMGVILTAAVLSVVMFSFWLHSESKAVLFTNLSPEDASSAMAELNKRDVEAELSDGGTTILVPEGEVYRLRVDLTAKGIPSSGTVGWGIFDGKQYGMTEFLQNVNFKRALEGELTRTIDSIQGIRAARVHLVMPRPSIFKKMQSPATASVMLSLARNTALSPSQIRGIQSLVAGSVEGLEVPHVAVLDQYGVELSESYDEPGVGKSEGQLAMKKEVDSYLSEKAETMLARVLGEGHAVVRVDATLNFEHLQQQKTMYDPDRTVVRSEERNEATGSSDGDNESSVTKYEIDQTVETVVGAVGGIKSMSVAVFVDSGKPADGALPAAAKDGADGGSAAPVALTGEQLKRIQRIVTTAVGLDESRGDRIEVVDMPFRTPDQFADGAPHSGSPLGMKSLPQLVGKGLLFGLLVVMAFRLKRSLGEIVDRPPVPRGATVAAVDDAKSDLPEADESVVGTENKLEEIRDYAGSSPQEIADLVQAWVHEAEGTSMPTRG